MIFARNLHINKRNDTALKRALIETVNENLKNITQIEHSRHHSFDNFIANALSALAAYCFFDKKTAIDLNLSMTGNL